MQKVVSTEEMREIEANLFEHLGMEEGKVIEAVGLRIFDFLQTAFSRTTFFFLIGKGNNGADGVAAARHCFAAGLSVKLFFLFPDEECSGELLKQINLARAFCIPTVEGVDESVLKSHLARQSQPVVFVDAILGIGYQPPLSESIGRIIKFVNSQNLETVSVDISSGVVASTGLVDEIAVVAKHTLAIEYPKLGHLVFEGQKYSGQLHLLKVGFPKLADHQDNLSLLSYDDLNDVKYFVDDYAHKNDFGHLLVVAGSSSMAGASILASHAAFAVGVGLITLKSWKEALPLIACRLAPEVMLSEISAFNDLERYECLLLGPGLSITDESKRLVQYLIEVYPGHLILDADALHILALEQNVTCLKKSQAKSVTITPHMGEFAKLLKIDVDLLREAVIDYVQEFAREYNVTVVLKDSTSYITSPQGKVAIAHFPNCALATAGSGDVLAGTLAGLIARQSRSQEICAHSFAMQAVLIHSKAGEMARAQFGRFSVAAGKLMSFYPEIFSLYCEAK